MIAILQVVEFTHITHSHCVCAPFQWKLLAVSLSLPLCNCRMQIDLSQHRATEVAKAPNGGDGGDGRGNNVHSSGLMAIGDRENGSRKSAFRKANCNKSFSSGFGFPSPPSLSPFHCGKEHSKTGISMSIGISSLSRKMLENEDGTSTVAASTHTVPLVCPCVDTLPRN